MIDILRQISEPKPSQDDKADSSSKGYSCLLGENMWCQICQTFSFSFRIAITKLDILDVFEEIKIGVAYWIGDRKVEDSFPGRYQRCYLGHIN